MRLSPHIKAFLRREDGTLLVFFMVSAITILAIVALSFDLGRRASTQTDMQAFVDNVVLAAAGELDGSSDAIANATNAAADVIDAANERLKAGTAGSEVTIALDQIVFYENLPDRDNPPSLASADLANPASPSYKYRLPPSDLGNEPDPTLARYVGVRLRTVDVPWMFAGIFSASDLPDEAIGAVAVAGKAAWMCDIAPVLFCLPEDGSGQPRQLDPGVAMNLRTARQFDTWREGEFGFVDVDIDPSGACAGLTDEAGRQACLITVQARIAACFQPNRADTEPGQRSSQESAAFNMSFDIFDQSMIQFFNDALYAPGPHSISGFVPANSTEICAPSLPSPDTMAFPLDDCHASSSCADGRIGDGDWDDGREDYVATNYSLPGADDSDIADGSFFDFPDSSLTRYEFYQLEIERAQNGGDMSAYYSGSQYGPGDDGERDTDDPEDPLTEYSNWGDFWHDDSPLDPYFPIIPPAHGRVDDGLPQCNLNLDPTPDPDRRVFLAGGIHCPTSGDTVSGFDEDVEIVDFYRLFQLAPTNDEVGLPPLFDLPVEVVERLDVDDLDSLRDVVQLFR